MPARFQLQKKPHAEVSRKPKAIEPEVPSQIDTYHTLLNAAHTMVGNQVLQAGFQGQALQGTGAVLTAGLYRRVAGQPVEKMSNSMMQQHLSSQGAQADTLWMDTQKQVAQAAQSGGRPLPPEVRAEMEARFGVDFSDVRIHTDGSAQQAAKAVQARAYTVGNEIWFGRGEWSPESQGTLSLLAHELSHVLQNRAGMAAVGGEQVDGVWVSSPNDAREQAAEATAQAVMQGPMPDLDTNLNPSPSLSVSTDAPLMREISLPAPTTTTTAESSDSLSLSALIRPISPTLADLLDKGLVGYFAPQVAAAVDAWIQSTLGDFSPETVVNDLLSGISKGAHFLMAAATGDQLCCTAWEGWFGGITQSVEYFVTSGSTLSTISNIFSSTYSLIFGGLGRLLDGGAAELEALIGPALADIQEEVDGLLADVSAINQAAGQEVAAFLGIDADPNGLSGLLSQGVMALVMQSEQVQAAIDGLLDFVFAIPGMESLYRMVDFFLELKKGIPWLAEHWGDEDLWTQVDGPLMEELPQFAERLKSAKATYEELSVEVTTEFNSGVALLDTWAVALTGFPLASGCVSLVKGLGTFMASVLNSPVWGEIASSLETAGEYAWTVLSWLVQAGIALTGVRLNPSLVFPVLVGGAIKLLPDCYKGPIFDFLATVLAAGASVLLAPLAVIMPPLAPLLQNVLVGTLNGVKSMKTEEKERVLNGLASYLTLGSWVEFGAGFCVGLVEGAVTDVLRWGELIVSIMEILSPYTWIDEVVEALMAMTNPLVSAVSEKKEQVDSAIKSVNDTVEQLEPMAKLLDEAGDRHFHEDAYAKPPEPKEVPKPEAPTFDSWEGFEAFFGDLAAQVSGAIQEASGTIALELMQGLLSGVDEPFSMGRKVGYVVGMVGAEVLIMCGTMGVGEIVNAGKLTMETMMAAVRTGGKAAISALKTTATVIRSMVSNLATSLSKIGATLLRGPVAWFTEGWEAFLLWVDELIVYLEGGAAEGQVVMTAEEIEAKKAADLAKLETQAVLEAKSTWDEFKEKDEMVTLKDVEAAFTKKNGPSVGGVDYVHSARYLVNTWTVEVQAASLAGKAIGVWGAGWIATDTDNKPVALAVHDVSDENHQAAEDALDSLEESWVKEGSEDALKAVADGLPDDFAKNGPGKTYKLMVLSAELSAVDEIDGTASATLTISPNATVVSRDFEHDVSKPQDPYAPLKDPKTLSTIHRKSFDVFDQGE